MITELTVGRIDDDLAQDIVGLGIRRCPRRHAGFQCDVETVLTDDFNAAIDCIHAEVTRGQSEAGAAHLANVGFAPVPAVVVAVAVVPVAGLSLSGVDVPVGVGERNAEQHDGGEADDKQSEAAHGTNLARWVRGWRHGSSLDCSLGGAQQGKRKHVPCRTAQGLEGCRFIELHKSGSVCGCPEEGLPVQEWTSRKGFIAFVPRAPHDGRRENESL